MQITTDRANNQVTQEAKDTIYEYLATRGVENPRELLLHQYNQGDYVCISYKGEYSGKNETRYLQVVGRITGSYWRNRDVSDNFGTIWVHRRWIEKVANQFQP